MKRLFILLTVLSLTISASASDRTPYNWYCQHVKNEQTPDIDPSMKFIENYSAVYIDKCADQNNKTIYLTFDAGYENGNVEKILDVLKEKDVKGAFFILRNLAEREPDLVRRMADEGHLVCNHTAKHYDMTTFSSCDDFICELEKLNNCVLERCGVETAKFYRPPEGRFNEQNLIWAKEAGYTTVFWSFAYADWDNDNQPDPKCSLDKIIQGVHPGEILLLHPTSATNAAILGDVIDALREKGYTFKTLDELAV